MISALSEFHAFLLDYFNGRTDCKTGRLVEPIVQGNSSFSVSLWIRKLMNGVRVVAGTLN